MKGICSRHRNYKEGCKLCEVIPPPFSDDLLSQIIRETWEVIHPSKVGQFADAQLFEGKWYVGKWGCDTLQHMVDIFNEKAEGQGGLHDDVYGKGMINMERNKSKN